MMIFVQYIRQGLGGPGRWLLLLAVAGLGEIMPRTLASDDAWSRMEEMRFQEAHQKFADLLVRHPEARDVQFGHAVSLLFRQPKTRTGLEAARGEFERLAAGPQDRWARAGRYYLARIDHLHAFEPDLSRAAAGYLALWREAPADVVGQRAFLHYAVIEQNRVESAATKRARWRQLDEEAAQLTQPALRAIYHYYTAESYQRWLANDREAYAHFREAAQVGLARLDEQANLLVRLGNLARRLDRSDEALHWYGVFLREYPRDIRVQEVLAAATELGGGASVGQITP